MIFCEDKAKILSLSHSPFFNVHSTRALGPIIRKISARQKIVYMQFCTSAVAVKRPKLTKGREIFFASFVLKTHFEGKNLGLPVNLNAIWEENRRVIGTSMELKR